MKRVPLYLLVIRRIRMTTEEKVARRKLSLLDLAQALGNVSKACKLMGYSRQQFYEIRRNYQTYGAAGLLDKLPGSKGPHPNRVAPEVEQAILAYSLQHPTHRPLRYPQRRWQGLCKPCWTAIAGSLSDGSTIANCPSPQCMF